MGIDLQIIIECGATTCASAPGKFCGYLGSRRFGQEPVCRLFPAEDAYTPLTEADGWIQRCPACLQATNEKVGRLPEHTTKVGEDASR